MNDTWWQVTALGYFFAPPEEDIAGSQWHCMSDILEELYMDNTANAWGNGYSITHAQAVKLTNEQREILQLPPLFPYAMYLKSSGDMGHSNFRYQIEWKTDKDVLQAEYKRMGSYIHFADDSQFMFNEIQYQIIRLTERCNEQIQHLTRSELSQFNYEQFAEIKKCAEKVNLQMDSYLTSLQVVVPDKLSIQIQKKADNVYSIIPVFFEEKADVLQPITEEKLYSQVNRTKKVNTVYSVGMRENRKKYVIKQDVREGIAEIKKYNSVDEKTIQQIAIAPQEIFDAPVFEIDDSAYSDRVIGKGEFIRKAIPYLKLIDASWLPEEGTAAYTDAEIDTLIITPDNLEEVQQKVYIAQEKNQNTIVVQGKTYPITPELLIDIKKTAYKIEEDGKKDEKESKKEVSLLIKDNIDDLSYTADVRKRKVDRTLWAKENLGLKEEIQLYPHQSEGIKWLKKQWSDGWKGVLLADDMGLGKTMQTFAFIAALKMCYKENMPPVLIVAPVSLLKNWQEEYAKFIQSNVFTNILALYGKNEKSLTEARMKVADVNASLTKQYMNQIVLTTYETLRKRHISWGQIQWSVMILDEAQKIKNPGIAVTNAVKAMKYDFGIALTGTPVENSWLDLWSIMDFAVPGKLGELKFFNEQYPNKLKQIRHDASALEELGKQLQDQLQPVFLRRLKKDYLEGLLQKRIIPLEKPMPDIQRNAYETVIHEARQQKEASKNTILKTIGMLRDISLCPDLSTYNRETLYSMDADEVIQSSARLQVTFDVLKDIQKRQEKVLIFVTSRKMQQLLRYLLIKKKYCKQILPPINGELLSERRQDIVAQFNQSEGFNILILSAEAGGVGFTITSANNVIHLSRSWNPAKEDQATDRVYRIGQTKDVNVYLPIAYDAAYPKEASFDEKLDQLLTYKRVLSESVLYPTGDSEQDGMRMFNDIMQNTVGADKEETEPKAYWSIEDMQNIEGVVFEKIICNLYNQIPGYTAEKTKDSYDNGVDVIAWAQQEGEENLLIQCKQTASDKNMGARGLEAVASAVKFYEGLYPHKHFSGVVITNANDFTAPTRLRAKISKVKLIAKKQLEALLQQHPLIKKIYHV